MLMVLSAWLTLRGPPTLQGHKVFQFDRSFIKHRFIMLLVHLAVTKGSLASCCAVSSACYLAN